MDGRLQEFEQTGIDLVQQMLPQRRVIAMESMLRLLALFASTVLFAQTSARLIGTIPRATVKVLQTETNYSAPLLM